MWISRKEYKFLKENAEKNIDAECEILRVKDKQHQAVARAMEEYSAVLEERDRLQIELDKLKRCTAELEHDIHRNCLNCTHNGWNMPQCAECEPENNFKWFEGK